MTKTIKTTNDNAADLAQFNMQASHEVGEIDLSDDAMLASMLNEIEEGIAGGDEITVAADAGAPAVLAVESEVESAGVPEILDAAGDDAALVDLTDDDAIEAAIAEIETADAAQTHYEAQGDDGVEHLFGDQPDADKPADAAAPDADKPAKEPKAPRVTYTANKASDVLRAKLGEKAGEMLILEVADAEMEPTELEAKQAELLALLNKRPGTGEGGSTQKKVAEKIVMLFGWLKSGGALNEVMRRTFEVLAKDGEITSGDKGNLHAHLLAKPYSVGTARAQAGQMMAMLPMLKIATKDGKGKLVANPDSMILMAAKAQLGL